MIKKNARILYLMGVVLLLALFSSGCSSEANNEVPTKEASNKFPTKPIEILIPGNPGGAMDSTARAIASIGSDPKYFGVPIVVRNNPGGNMTFAAESMMKADADGYTLHIAGDAPWVTSPLTVKVSYDPQNDVAYLAKLNVMQFGWGVPANSKFKDFDQLMDYVKEHPGEVSMGVGGGTYQLWQDILAEQGYVFNNIPFDGGAEAAPQLAGGHVDVAGISTVAAKPLVASGDVRMLFYGPAVEGEEGPIQGVPSMDKFPLLKQFIPLSSSVSVTSRSGVPDERKKFIKDTLHAISQDKAYLVMMKNMGQAPTWVNSADYTSDVTIYRDVVNKMQKK